MIVSKINPVGVDLMIDFIQTNIDSNLSTDLGSWKNYPRVYMNPKSGKGYIPEHYVSANKYVETLFDDKFDCVSFFYADPDVNASNGYSKFNCSLVFQLKLSKLFPSIPHRADEEFRVKVSQILRNCPQISTLDNVYWGVKDVFKDFDQSRISFMDMSQTHCVRFEFTLVVDDLICDCC